MKLMDTRRRNTVPLLTLMSAIFILPVFAGSQNMFTIPEWPVSRVIWAHDALKGLLEYNKSNEVQNVTLEEIEENSKNFPIEFPIESVRCKSLAETVPKETLERYINSAYPVLHENALRLYWNFLYHKKKFGRRPERELYANMTLLELVERMISKRAVAFLERRDVYLLLDKTRGVGKWESIGTDEESDELNLRKCLSYDEIKLSAFLSVSSYTNFINDGSRHNEGVPNRSNVEPEGVIIGLIGARLEKPRVMEYAEIIIAEDQNDERNGYGTQFAPTVRSMFSGFYGEISLTYREFQNFKDKDSPRFNEVRPGIFFDNSVYCKRVGLSIDTLLIEANQRAKERNTTAFVYAVGIGLGVWKFSPHQKALFLDTFAKRIQVLGENLHSVSDVVFGYFDENATAGGFKSHEVIPIPGHPKNGVKIQMTKREPHVKLSGTDEGKLLVISYAWDGNALPGNEFWLGSLSGSGDPAAASSTQIAELHNPHINPKVRAENLRIVTPNGVLSYHEYCEHAKKG